MGNKAEMNSYGVYGLVIVWRKSELAMNIQSGIFIYYIIYTDIRTNWMNFKYQGVFLWQGVQSINIKGLRNEKNKLIKLTKHFKSQELKHSGYIAMALRKVMNSYTTKP
jgi:hypothetical protein